MTTKTKMPEPDTPEWEKLADSVARDFAPEIYPCKHCKGPVAKGWICGWCGSSSPR